MNFCHETVNFGLPDVFYTSYFCDKKPTVLLHQLRKITERFMNTGSVLCSLSENYDTSNVGRKERLCALDRVTFDVDAQLRCGWMILLGDDFNIKLVFFLEYEKRFVLIKNEEEFLSMFKNNIVELDEAHNGVFLFDSGVIKIKTDDYGMRWLIVSELLSWKGMNPEEVQGPFRVVISETQFYALRQILNNRVRKARCEISYLMSTYNVVLREIVAFTRINIRSDCSGCMRSGPGDMYNCGRGDTLCIESMLHMCLQKKRLANRNKCLEFVYENISYIFPTIARRLKEEMHHEEHLLNYYSGGMPEYVKHCNDKERKFPMSNNMDYDM